MGQSPTDNQHTYGHLVGLRPTLQSSSHPAILTVIAWKERPGLVPIRFLAGIVLSLAMLALPRRVLEATLRRLLRRGFYPTSVHMALFKSGRSAVAAVFRAMARRHPGAAVLVPDYICNVIHRAAVPYDVRLVTYRTDARFQVDLDDLEAKIRAESAKGVLLASLFGSQGRSRSVIDRIRAIDRELVLIVDDCQNLVTGAPFRPDDNTVVVFSFNMKHVPGVMGGGVCSAANPLGLEEPRRDFPRDLALELIAFLALLRQVAEALLRGGLALCGRARSFPAPELEFSDCRRRLYDTRVERIARLSLARGILGLSALQRIETQRRENFAKLREALERAGWGRIVLTENVEVAPLVAVEGLHPGLVGRLPLKGPYARDDDPAASLWPDLLVIGNDGFCPFDLVAQPSLAR